MDAFRVAIDFRYLFLQVEIAYGCLDWHQDERIGDVDSLVL